MTVSQHARLRELLPSRIEFVATSGLVEELRAVKQPEEIAAIKAAAALADEAFAQLVAGRLTGHTERDLALKLEYELRRHGAERPSFDPIVAAGPHGALPHARPRDELVAAGELVVIDWGAQLDGYCSDCTRTLATGEIDGEAQEIYQLVLDAQLAALEEVKPGVVGRDVDSVPRAAITAAGYGDQFGHGLGHGVGLEVHEAPRLAQPSEAVLVPGNVVTVEPGIYIPGRFGVRIEDLVVRHGRRIRDPHIDLQRALGRRLSSRLHSSRAQDRAAPRCDLGAVSERSARSAPGADVSTRYPRVHACGR